MSEYFIYLIEEPGAALDAVKKYHDDLMVEKTKWRTWAQENVPEAEGVSVDKEGYCWGVKFPIGKLPDNWRKPDRKTGLSWPRVNNPIRETMPENKRLKNECVYTKAAGLEIPTGYRIYKDGQKIHSYSMGHWFNPIQFGFFGQEPGQCCIVTPNYEEELGRAALNLKDGETMQPGVDFDWKNMLPGCRLIRGYEWDYLCKKHKEQKNDTV